MTSAHDRYLARSYFSSLDGLRCLAILPVIWHHSTPRPLPGIWGKGPAGVDLFFCVSGFLITTLLVREKARAGSIHLGAFYARRALRILPLYYGVLALYVLYACTLSQSFTPRAHFFLTLPYYATFTANWFGSFAVSHPILFAFSWSLCIEEQFYASWPWLVKKLSGTSALVAMLALIVLDLATERGALASLIAPGSLGERVITGFPTPIGLGAVLALLLQRKRAFAFLEPILAPFWSAPLSLLSVLALLIWPNAPLLVFHLGLTWLVAACVVSEQNGLSRLLTTKAASYVGRVSYGLYLLNATAVALVHRAFPAHVESSGFVFALSLPLALVLASLSQRFVEEPCLRLRARFRGGAPGVTPAPESVAPPSPALPQ